MDRTNIRTVGAVIAISFAVLLAGCTNGEIGPPGGIQMLAEVAPQESPTDVTGEGGVFDSGQWESYIQSQQNSKGTQTSFSGVTDPFGNDFHPDAVDDSWWEVSFDFSVATGFDCLSGSMAEPIKSGGATVVGICLLPSP